jgi:hypothetical protein
MTRKMVIISVFIMCIALVFIAGCIGEKPLTRDQATIKIASLGSADEPFTLWVDEPGCCKEIFYYEIESDGARTIQSVRESDSKFYFDSTPEEARIILMNGKNDVEERILQAYTHVKIIKNLRFSSQPKSMFRREQ